MSSALYGAPSGRTGGAHMSSMNSLAMDIRKDQHIRTPRDRSQPRDLNPVSGYGGGSPALSTGSWSKSNRRVEQQRAGSSHPTKDSANVLSQL